MYLTLPAARRTRQPQGPVRVELSRLPQSGRNIRSIHDLRPGINRDILKPSRAWTQTGTLGSTTFDGGIGTDFSSFDLSGATELEAVGGNGNPEYSHTIAFVIKPNSIALSGIVCFSDSRANAVNGSVFPYGNIRLGASGAIELYSAVSGGSVVVGKAQAFVVTYRDTDGSWRLYDKSGLLGTSGSSIWWTNAYWTCVIGNGYPSNFSGAIPLVIQQRVEWTADEAVRWCINPWSLFSEPQWLYTGMGSGSWTPLEVTG